MPLIEAAQSSLALSTFPAFGLTKVIVALLIIGGPIYSYSGTATHVASNTAPVPCSDGSRTSSHSTGSRNGAGSHDSASPHGAKSSLG